MQSIKGLIFLSVTDPQHFRKVVLWLEDQKIRQYDIQDRKDLRNIKSEYWPKAFAKYCKDVQCPIIDNDVDQLEWLIGCAIWLEADNDSKYFLTNAIKDLIYYYLNSVAQFILRIKYKLITHYYK